MEALHRCMRLIFHMFWTYHLLGTIVLASYRGVQEYCQWESFNATCASDEVVLVETAEYGRMQLGRCITREYGSLGCGLDVKAYVDKRCSGRHTCSFSIPDPVLDAIQRCPNDLKSYFRASYNCVKVLTGDGQLCRGAEYIRLTQSTGHIASVITEEMQLGSEACPWMIEADHGQRIVISLYDFALWQSGEGGMVRPRPETSGICHIYAQIRERASAGSITVCGGDEREKTVYTSESNKVTIQVANMRLSKSPAYFMLKYEIIGCADVVTTSTIQYERTGNTVSLTCRTTGVTWELRCEGNKWQGLMQNCTEVKAWGLTNFIEGAISMPQGILIAIIIGIALFIAVVILAVGLWTLRRKHSLRTPKASSLIADGKHYATRGGGPDAAKEQYPMLANQERYPIERDRDYTSTWQRRAQVPGSAAMTDMAFSRGDYPSNYHRHPSHYAYHDSGLGSINTFRPHVEHIYESPKFDRKDLGDGPFYHELDPELSDASSGPHATIDDCDLMSPPDIPLPPIPVEHNSWPMGSDALLPDSATEAMLPLPPPPREMMNNSSR